MIYRWIVWSLGTERRVVWIFGVTLFGGFNAGWWLWYQGALGLKLLPLLVLWLAMGYMWGWIIWQIIKRIRPHLARDRTSN